ncbi:MAG: thiolase family protein [Rhizobiales bacterium]|nr:thiolase family protein [Hyphomicrobiales bacterium]
MSNNDPKAAQRDPIVIVGMARTPIGSFMGSLTSKTASQLGGVAIAAALKSANISGEDVSENIMGNVLSAGQGQAPARQAGFHGGLGKGVPAVTINKMCGSGMKAAMMAHDQLLAHNGNILIAGGMESMTQAPYMLPNMRMGARLGHSNAVDHMMRDGLEDAYEQGQAMGVFAETCADKYKFTREAQDEFAITSLARAKAAQSTDAYKDEVTPITISTRKGDTIVELDEQVGKAMPDKIPRLKPVFKKDGTVTAANASSISDGAAALVLMRESDAKKSGANIIARILSHGSNSHEPQWFTTAPVGAITNALNKAGLKISDVDLWEINEAFAVVPMAAMAELDMDHSVVNVNGGACAVGHPIGASGARIIVTLLNALKAHDKNIGVAALCIGGGEGTAMVLERAS